MSSFSLVSCLRKLGFNIGPTRIEREQAEVENILRDNNEAFEATSQVYNHVTKTTAKLAKAVGRAKGSNPFGDLEDLTNLRRLVREGQGKDKVES